MSALIVVGLALEMGEFWEKYITMLHQK